MNQNTTLPVLAVLLALVLMTRGPDTTSDKIEGSLGVTRAQLLAALNAATEEEEERLSPDVRVLARHFGLLPLGKDAAKSGKADTIGRAVDARLAKRAPELQIVLASLPDPIDSHLRYMFDQGIDALQRAAADLHYTLQGYTWAWRAGSGQAEASTEHRTEPGALLFHRAGDEAEPERLLLVLLIGETPTGGIQPLALAKALEIAAWRLPNAAATERLAFIGPTFSGSASSLARALEHRADLGFEIDFYSGSATAKTLGDALPKSRAKLHRLTHDDVIRMDVFHDYLKHRGDADRRVVLLVEGGTAYGEAAANPNGGLIRFPLHVSQLRSSSEARGKSEEKKGTLATPFGRSALDLALRDAGAALDVPQPFARELSANVAELELAASLATLRERRAGYVGVVATDKRDELLIAQILRRVAPEVHLFTLESDVLYAHPRFSQELLGTLVVSSYPLTASLNPRLQAWSGARTPGAFGSQSFGSGGADGSYRAALIAFAGQERCDRCDEIAEALPCLWVQDGAERPPVWISAIGRDGPWPIWTAPSEGDAALRLKPLGSTASAATDLVSVRPSIFYRGALAGLALVCGLFSLLYASAVVPNLAKRAELQSLAPEKTVLDWLYRDMGRVPRVASAGFLLACFMLLAWSTGLALLPIAAETRANALNVAWELWDLAIPVGVVWLALLPALLLASARAFVAFRPSGAHLLGCYAAATLVVGGGGWLAVRLQSGPEAANWLLFALRSTHPESGLSPVVPTFLLALGLLVMIGVMVRRAQLYEHREKIRVELGGCAAPYTKELVEELRPQPSLSGITVFAAAAYLGLFALPAATFLFTAWLPLDGRIPKWVFICLMIALLASLVRSGVGFMTIWMRMRRLLVALASSPLRDAFGRLPLRMSRGVGLEPYASPCDVAELQYSVELAQVLRRVRAGLPNDSPASAVDLSDSEELGNKLARDVAVAAPARHRWPTLVTETQPELCKLADALAPALAKWWNRSGEAARVRGADPLPPPRSEDPDERPLDGLALVQKGAALDEPLWFRLAEEFVAAQTVAFLSYVFVHLRASLRGTTTALVLLLLAVTTYPFEPQVPTLNFVVLLIAVAVVAAITAFAQASRNELLSLIEGTTPNKLTWNANLITQLMTYVALPLLAALAAQLPMLGRMLSTLFASLTTR